MPYRSTLALVATIASLTTACAEGTLLDSSGDGGAGGDGGASSVGSTTSATTGATTNATTGATTSATNGSTTASTTTSAGAGPSTSAGTGPSTSAGNTSAASGGGCGPTEAPCPGGGCFDILELCDGVQNCTDGFDEDPTLCGTSTGSGGTPPMGWTCTPSYYGDQLCDCGCGVQDSDCPTGMASECQYCDDINGCAVDTINCSDIDPMMNWLCVP